MAGNPAWTVTDVKANEDYTLHISFIGGERRWFNAKPLLQKAIYSPLKHLPFFLQAKAECGTVVWSDEVDIAPEHLYKYSIPLE